MNNTTTATARKFNTLLVKYVNAHYRYTNSRVGAASRKAEQQMTDIIEQAEQAGFVDEFVQAINDNLHS